MPYTNVPPELTDKMDRCVDKVMDQGFEKERAIAICYDSVVAKKEARVSGEKVKVSPQAKAIAEKADRKNVTPEDVQTKFIDAWNESVMGTPASNLLQKVGARTFGHRQPPELEDVEMDWSLLYPMGAMYNLTQEALQGRGYSREQTIPVYHPYIPTQAVPKGWAKGQEVRIMLNPLTSWSTSLRDAATFAAHLASPSAPALVLKTYIPVGAIISTPQTGIGMQGTHEVVLAGGEYEALVEVRYGAGGKQGGGRWVTIEDRPVFIGGPGQGAGGTGPVVRAGITSARPGKDIEQIKKEMEKFVSMLQETDVDNLRVQLGVGGWEGGQEPTFVTSYEGNGEALKTLARAGKQWEQDGVLVMQRVEEGGEPLSTLSFKRDLGPEQMDAVEGYLVKQGFGGWTWGRDDEGTVLMAVNVPQWGGDAERHKAGVAAVADTLRSAGMDIEVTEEFVLVIAMGPDSYDEFID